MNAVFFDTETGGLKMEHPIIQIAAIAVDAEWQELEVFEAKIAFDPAVCEAEALAKNHYDADVWAAQARLESDVIKDFNAFLRRHARMQLTSKTGRPYRVARLAGHNIASFDIPRVRAAMDRHKQYFAGCWWYPLDTYALALWRYYDCAGPDNYQLSTLAKYNEIEVPVAHEALADVRTNIAVAKRLTDLWRSAP